MKTPVLCGQKPSGTNRLSSGCTPTTWVCRAEPLKSQSCLMTQQVYRIDSLQCSEYQSGTYQQSSSGFSKWGLISPAQRHAVCLLSLVLHNVSPCHASLMPTTPI